MPRFVILTHDHPTLHWDLMLEMGATLRTWRLTAAPTPGCEMAAEPIPDHRPMYLDYEGPVSGNRGSVTRWDAGTFEVIEESLDRLAVRLSGTALSGRVEIKPTPDKQRWTFHLFGIIANDRHQVDGDFNSKLA
jgi:hypothetical protein